MKTGKTKVKLLQEHSKKADAFEAYNKFIVWTRIKLLV
jgi:hypothetical protein